MTEKIHGASGYGCDGWNVGDVIRNGPHIHGRKEWGEYLYVEATKERWIGEDGMSFGVGDESGYLYSATVRTATDEESKPLREKDEAHRKRSDGRKKCKELFRTIFAEGEAPEVADPLGEEVPMPGNPMNIYGGGEWFIVGTESIWAIRNNGRDGDAWSANNVGTGGAGAIGRCVPFDAELAKSIRDAATKGA